MKKDTVNAIVQRLSIYIYERVERDRSEQLPKEDLRIIMEDEMGWVDERTQNKWMRILGRRKIIIPINKKVFYVPENRQTDQKTLVQFDVPEVKVVKK